MTIKSRIARICIIEQMKELEKTCSNIVRTEDGTLNYVTEEGKIMVSSKK